MTRLIALLLILGSLMISSCYRSPDGVRSGTKKAASEEPLLGLAEIARGFGYRVPANEDMVRSMRLPTDKDGKYYIWQFGLSPKDKDLRGIDVGDRDGMIILTRVDTRPDAFERYCHLTSARGELRCTEYTTLVRRERRVIRIGDPGYPKALVDFEAQVMFWTSRELEIRAKFPDGAPRQAWGAPLELR